MSSFIFNGSKDGVVFAIFANYQVIIRSQIKKKHAAIHGKAHLSFPGMPHADLPCGAEYYPRGKSSAGDPHEWK